MNVSNQFVTGDLRRLVAFLAAKSDIHSLYCPFQDFALWELLVGEQLRRSAASGLPPRQAFALIGPEEGIPGVTKHFGGDDCELEYPASPDPLTGRLRSDCWGGDIHIPYEGATGADLVIVPSRFNFHAERLDGERPKLGWAIYRPCNYVLIRHDFGDLPNTTRTLFPESWVLYKSLNPYQNCNPFTDDCG